MNDTVNLDIPHADPVASARDRKAQLEARGKSFERVEVRKAGLPGLTLNQDAPLEIWLTPDLIRALERRTARLEVVLSDPGLVPMIVMDEFRGAIRAGFRSGDAALVMERARNFNMRALFYDRSYMQIGVDSSCNTCLATLSDASIVLGQDCMLSHDVTFQPSDQHDIVDLETGEIINHKRSIILEDHVWIGKEAYLGAGCHVGTGAIIGARSVVVGPVAANTIVAGNPVRLIRAGTTWKRSFNAVKTAGEAHEP